MKLRTIQKLFLIALLTSSFSVFAADKIDWNGFYGSVLAGRTFGDINKKDGQFTWLYSDGSIDSSHIDSGDNKSFNGWNGSLKLGFNKQLNDNLLGIEFGITAQSARANGVSITNVDGAPEVPHSLLSKVRVNTYESLNARLGHIFNDATLVYVSGGAALGQLKSKVYQNDCDVAGCTHLWMDNAGDSMNSNKTELGYTLGLGLENKLNDKLSLRVNYEYVDFGDVNFKYSGTASGASVNQNQKTSVNFSNLSAGVSYAF